MILHSVNIIRNVNQLLGVPFEILSEVFQRSIRVSPRSVSISNFVLPSSVPLWVVKRDEDKAKKA